MTDIDEVIQQALMTDEPMHDSGSKPAKISPHLKKLLPLNPPVSHVLDGLRFTDQFSGESIGVRVGVPVFDKTGSYKGSHGSFASYDNVNKWAEKMAQLEAISVEERLAVANAVVAFHQHQYDSIRNTPIKPSEATKAAPAQRSTSPAPPKPKKAGKLYVCTEDRLAEPIKDGENNVSSLSEMIALLCEAHQDNDTHRFDVTVHGPTGQYLVKRIAVGAAPLKLLKKVGGEDFHVGSADSFKEEKFYVLINQKKEKKVVAEEKKKEPKKRKEKAPKEEQPKKEKKAKVAAEEKPKPAAKKQKKEAEQKKAEVAGANTVPVVLKPVVFADRKPDVAKSSLAAAAARAAAAAIAQKK